MLFINSKRWKEVCDKFFQAYLIKVMAKSSSMVYTGMFCIKTFVYTLNNKVVCWSLFLGNRLQTYFNALYLMVHVCITCAIWQYECDRGVYAQTVSLNTAFSACSWCCISRVYLPEPQGDITVCWGQVESIYMLVNAYENAAKTLKMA